MKEFFKRKPGKIVILVLSILLSQITAMLFLKAFANLESWFGMYLNDSASIYCGCVLLIQVFLTSFFLDKGFSVSVLIALAEVGICLFIGISEIYWDIWSTTTNGILCFALIILLVLLFSWNENGDRYTKGLLSFLTTLYAVGVLNIALVWIDDIWRVLIRAVVAVILLAVSCQLIISAMGKKAFRGLSLLSAFACVFQTWLWLYMMKESIFQPFPDGLIPAGWKTRWCLAVQGMLVLGFGLSAIVLGIRSARSGKKVSGREAGKIGNALTGNSVKRFTSVAIVVVMLFAAVFSVSRINEKDRRWKHLDGLLSAGKLAEAVEWMDLHPWDIPHQKAYQDWVLSCMEYEKIWEYDFGNNTLIPREGSKHEVKPLLKFCPHVTISNNIADMLLEDEENNVIFELSDHNDDKGFTNEWGSFINVYETREYDHKSPQDETDYYLTYEDENRLVFLQYDMDRVLIDYCVYKAAGVETDPGRSPEQRDLEIRQRWVFNPFYEKVELVGG